MPYKDKEKQKKHNKEYYEKNRDKWKSYGQNRKEYMKRWWAEHKGYMKNWRKETRGKSDKKYYLKNKDKIKKYKKDWDTENQEHLRNYERHKRKTDKNHLIKCRLRTRLRHVLKIYTETEKIMTSKKYGIDYKLIIEHLKPFPEDLSKYDIHHIKALFTFNFINPDGSTNLEEIKKAFAPENHQWLTIQEHRSKWRKIEKQSLIQHV